MAKYFKDYEFRCKCGCGANNMNIFFINKLDVARELAGVPFKITSGYRCVNHNKSLGTTDTSSHLIGVAADIEAKTDHDRYKILQALIRVGFKRIGVSFNFIHVDDDETKKQEIVWIY